MEEIIDKIVEQNMFTIISKNLPWDEEYNFDETPVASRISYCKRT
jgi:hypothetical protein